MEECSVRPLNLPERAKNPLDGQTVEKFNLLIYWFQESGITYPTLQMIKIYPKRRLFNNKNDLFFNGVRLQGFALEHTIIFANDECVMGT